MTWTIGHKQPNIHGHYGMKFIILTQKSIFAFSRTACKKRKKVVQIAHGQETLLSSSKLPILKEKHNKNF